MLPDAPDADVLVALVDRMLGCPSVSLPGPVSLARTATVLGEFEWLRFAALDGVKDLDARELYALDGAGSTAGWLRARRVGSRVASLSLARSLTVGLLCTTR